MSMPTLLMASIFVYKQRTPSARNLAKTGSATGGAFCSKTNPMAQRRMFSLQIVDSDAFLEMPQSSQLLYYNLAMRADDDGFVDNPRKIMRMVGTNEDDLKILIAKRFILTFESGIIVIKHWKIHNYIQNDRYKETKYVEEKSQITVKDNGSYTERIQNGYNLDTQVRLGKVRLGKVKEEATSQTLEQSFKQNPLWGSITAKYPDRDYDYQFGLMCDWWLANKKRLPKSITAFENWLKNTKPDGKVIADKEAKWQKEKTENMISDFGKDLSRKMKNVE